MKHTNSNAQNGDSLLSNDSPLITEEDLLLAEEANLPLTEANLPLTETNLTRVTENRFDQEEYEWLREFAKEVESQNFPIKRKVKELTNNNSSSFFHDLTQKKTKTLTARPKQDLKLENTWLKQENQHLREEVARLNKLLMDLNPDTKTPTSFNF